MRGIIVTPFVALLLFSGCSNFQQAAKQTNAPRPILVDEYSVLDDTQATAQVSEKALQTKLEEARRHYLRAMKLAEQNNPKTASQHFEAAITILNDLATYPDIEASPEFTKLTESVIRDYEEQVTSIDDLDPNSSFFVLRDKMFQEIEMIPVAWRSTSTNSAAVVTGGDLAQVDTLPQIELTENEAVEQTIAYFTSERGRKFFSRWLARSGKYFPMYERILEEEGAPEELKHLSMIESGLNPTAVSWAKAVGLWQFIPSTGKEYGLQIDWYKDERRDPEKATRAAVRYLMDLHKMMGDWHLALASYNCGPGRMRGAVEKADTNDYWEARKFLPRETQQYVPLYIAATKIAKDPEKYGFTGIEYEAPDQYDTVSVKGGYDFSTLSGAAGTTTDELTRLNPELLQGRVPPDEELYTLRVPHGTAEPLTLALQSIPVPELPKVTWRWHKVKRGETISKIAGRYGVQTSDVLAANNMSRKSRLLRGTNLKIPVYTSTNEAKPGKKERDVTTGAEPNEENLADNSVITGGDTDDKEVADASDNNDEADADETFADAEDDEAEDEPALPVYYVVSRGETLTGIAGKHGVSVETLASWNNIAADTRVNSGQRLKLFMSDDPASGSAPSASLASLPSTAERKNGSVPVQNTPAPVAAKASESIAAKSTPAPKAAKPTTTTTSKYETHKVRRGETLSGIADKYGVSVQDIKAWNSRGVRGNDVLAGARLKIYSESPSKGDSRKSSRVSRSSSVKKYRVRRGETFFSIAQKFGVSTVQLKKNNPKVNPRALRAGQVIRIQ